MTAIIDESKIEWDVYSILDIVNNYQNLDNCYQVCANLLLYYYWKINYKIDWDMMCATLDNFVNLAVSVAWFWETEELAKKDLLEQIYKDY